jgi:hypothetical protein
MPSPSRSPDRARERLAQRLNVQVEIVRGRLVMIGEAGGLERADDRGPDLRCNLSGEHDTAGQRLELLGNVLERAADLGVGIHRRVGAQEPELRSHDARVSRAGGQDCAGCRNYTLACGLLLITAPGVAASPFCYLHLGQHRRELGGGRIGALGHFGVSLV